MRGSSRPAAWRQSRRLRWRSPQGFGLRSSNGDLASPPDKPQLAFTQHWKTKKTQVALEKLALAAVSDAPGADLSGLAVVTGVAV